ncbi:MAG: PD40 domain-containing protein [Magnetococcales bacterium]|nr:PD40 domain-containing protein [Magnetococcales bacterium]
MASPVQRVSVASNGTEGNNHSDYAPAVSADGRYVAFRSYASNLVSGDSNNLADIFVRDTRTGTTTRVSVASDGSQGNGNAMEAPALSADGRYVAFMSDASNLVNDDTNNAKDIFVHDTATKTTTRVSVVGDNTQGNKDSWGAPALSADGRYVAFTSLSSNFYANDSSATWDIFVRDTVANTTQLASVSLDGRTGNQHSWGTPALSDDGRYVAFTSYASNLVADDTNSTYDTFVRDMQGNSTIRVSVASDGTQANGAYESSYDDGPAISADGRYVAFMSLASNLVSGDTNGKRDVFVYDRTLQQTSRVSVASDGAQASDASGQSPDLSADGRFVVFGSSAVNLVSNDNNGEYDIFVHDRDTGMTRLVSVAANATQQYGSSVETAALSADGSTVAFQSYSANLVSGDTNDKGDIFVVTLSKSLSAVTDLDLDAVDDNGRSSSDNITSQTSGLTIRGSGGVAGNKLVLFDDKDDDGLLTSGEPLTTVTLTGNSWNSDIRLLIGTHSVRALQRDSDGNNSPVSDALMITVTAPALAVPTGLDLAAADDSGKSTSDNITKNTKSLTITGTGKKGAVVILLDGETPLGTVAVTAATGKWSRDVTLSSGSHAIRATQKMGSSLSDASAALLITVDTTPPAAPSSPDLDIADDNGTDSSNNITSLTKGLNFSGSGEAGATVTLFADKNKNNKQDSSEKTLATVIVDENGLWRSKDLAMAIGSYSLRAFQTDLAGNIGSMSGTLGLSIVKASATKRAEWLTSQD